MEKSCKDLRHAGKVRKERGFKRQKVKVGLFLDFLRQIFLVL